MDKHIETLNIMESAYSHIRISNSKFSAIEAAKEALQEQAERENGCSLCNGERLKNVAIVNHWEEDQIALVSGKVDENEQFVFCPKCGRRLK